MMGVDVKLLVKVVRDTEAGVSRWTVVCERDGKRHKFQGEEHIHRDARRAAAGVASLCCTSDLDLVVTEDAEG
jgi:hypothetical protein